VACCSGLQRLKVRAARTPWNLTSTSAFECLHHLTSLVALHLSTVDDQQCNSLAELTGLRRLELDDPQELSAVGLRQLVRLQQLTSLYFWGVFDSSKVSTGLQAQLRAVNAFLGSTLVLANKVRATTCRSAMA